MVYDDIPALFRVTYVVIFLIFRIENIGILSHQKSQKSNICIICLSIFHSMTTALKRQEPGSRIYTILISISYSNDVLRLKHYLYTYGFVFSEIKLRWFVMTSANSMPEENETTFTSDNKFRNRPWKPTTTNSKRYFHPIRWEMMRGTPGGKSYVTDIKWHSLSLCSIVFSYTYTNARVHILYAYVCVYIYTVICALQRCLRFSRIITPHEQYFGFCGVFSLPN